MVVSRGFEPGSSGGPRVRLGSEEGEEFSETEEEGIETSVLGGTCTDQWSWNDHTEPRESALVSQYPKGEPWARRCVWESEFGGALWPSAKCRRAGVKSTGGWMRHGRGRWGS